MSSYRVLARKWRPQKFQDIVGQEPIVRTLQNALRRDRVAHAMIFSGVRGVGKTTIARIMAKAINCHHPDEAPCDRCSSCQSIINGNAIDLHEIDGASNRGIQEIRDLKENIRFLPAQERFKVVIIDEVHMLTVEAFNALLKTLEEPPEHVFFMFATTEIHKVPVTILSRCQRYELKRVPFAALRDFFAAIAQREGVTITQAAVDIIAGEADGSVRDGLSLLDQIFSFGGDAVTEDDLRLVLGLVDRRIFARIVAALLRNDLPGALSLLNETYNQGMDLKRFAQGLLAFCRALLVVKTSKEPAAILDISEQEMALLVEIASGSSLETLGGVFTIMLRGAEEMQYAAHPRMVLEMLFVKATQLGEVAPIGLLLSRLDALLAGQPQPLPSSPCPPKGAPVAPATAVPSVAQSLRNPEASVPRSAVPMGGKSEIPASPTLARGGEPEDSSDDDEGEEIVPPPAPLQVLRPQSRDVQRDWDDFLRYVRERKPWMAGTLNQADKVGEEGGALVLRYNDASECHVLQDGENRKLLTEFAQDFFQKELPVRIRAAGENHALADQGQPQEERRALAREPRVQVALEIFGGQISGIRTEPRSR